MASVTPFSLFSGQNASKPVNPTKDSRENNLSLTFFPDLFASFRETLMNKTKNQEDTATQISYPLVVMCKETALTTSPNSPFLIKRTIRKFFTSTNFSSPLVEIYREEALTTSPNSPFLKKTTIRKWYAFSGNKE